MFKMVLLIGAGGFAGTVARYLTFRFVQTMFPLLAFPVATFSVNLVGSFIIGLLYTYTESHTSLSPEFRIMLATGFCGGFTTFSAFAYENFSFIKSGNVSLFLLYTALSILVGLGAVYFGYRIGKLI